MTNIENYIFNIENDNITKKGAQALLSNVICELGFLSAEEWAEIFKLMNSNSLGVHISEYLNSVSRIT